MNKCSDINQIHVKFTLYPHTLNKLRLSLWPQNRLAGLLAGWLGDWTAQTQKATQFVVFAVNFAPLERPTGPSNTHWTSIGAASTGSASGTLSTNCKVARNKSPPRQPTLVVVSSDDDDNHRCRRQSYYVINNLNLSLIVSRLQHEQFGEAKETIQCNFVTKTTTTTVEQIYSIQSSGSPRQC